MLSPGGKSDVECGVLVYIYIASTVPVVIEWITIMSPGSPGSELGIKSRSKYSDRDQNHILGCDSQCVLRILLYEVAVLRIRIRVAE